MKSLYIIGSLRNDNIPNIANELRNIGIEEFSDWYAAGPTADDCWRDYEKGRGKTYAEALGGYAAKHVFEFDKYHLDRCDAALLVYPAGKSAHLELGYMAGKGKPTFVLLDNPERWDVMLQFATKVFMDKEEMMATFQQWVDADRLQSATTGFLTKEQIDRSISLINERHRNRTRAFVPPAHGYQVVNHPAPNIPTAGINPVYGS